MSLNLVPPGKNIPDEINVIIEVPAHSDPVKYEVDHDSGAIMVDRFMSAAMFYPCNYGYIPNTLADDGDPLDVLVHTPHTVVSGCVIPCRPVGILQMSDEAGEDAKLIAVPTKKLSPLYNDVQEATDLPPLLIQQITHFFEHYKDLEDGKWVKVEGWGTAADARAAIEAAVAAYAKAEDH
ncbi:inorganic diphosphatase [Parahaliea maris]|uniref:Inorganic pyrophosphatase n=1 Tax=Parahaliea maris TaxID=2716870 RepID=A0A5C9A675_9GAMM|nr:inorganic diphosphatase [Parahaliea maris]TXS96435.1 inorganic diphosphatase [Parahaliea maris]